MITDRTAWLVSLAGGIGAYGYISAHALCETIAFEQSVGIVALTVGSLFLLLMAASAALSFWWPGLLQPRLWIGNPYDGGHLMSAGQIVGLTPVLAAAFLFCLYAAISSWCFSYEIVPIRSRGANTVLTSDGPTRLLATLTPAQTAP